MSYSGRRLPWNRQAWDRASFAGSASSRRRPSFPSSNRSAKRAKTLSSSQPSSSQSSVSGGYTARRPILIDSDDDDDFNEIFSQSQPIEVDDYVSLGYIGGRIVGVQYYRGIATMDENLLLVREPNNRYDRNAIRVDNVLGIQVGHIPRDIAAIFAPFLDSKALKIEGTVTGMNNSYVIPISIQLFAPRLQIMSTLLQLQHRVDIRQGPVRESGIRPPKLPTIQPPQPPQPPQRPRYVGSSLPSSSPPVPTPPPPPPPVLPSYNELLERSVAFDPRQLRDAPEKFGLSIKDLESLPLAKQPAQVKTGMLSYQLQGLAWLMRMEHPKLPVGNEVREFWTSRGRNWYNVATHFTTTQAPQLARGGILADDMGLGKTLQIISLLVADPKLSDVDPNPIPEGAHGTLIVAPISLLSNWTSQIEQHLHPETLKVLVFHGKAKNDPKIDFDDYDVVITSYGNLVADYKSLPADKSANKTKRGLFGRLWKRAVLDEAHTIRNPNAKMSLAASRLDAVSRWSLTGTPIVNEMSDLYSQMRFLRFSGGFSQSEIFNRLITRPLRNGDSAAAGRLQLLMGGICLRRRKDMKFGEKHIIELPDFSPEEKKKYLILENEAKGMLDKIKDGENKGFSFILEVLLRMRQFSDHWSLCQQRLEALIELAKKPTVDLTPENITLLQQMLDLAIDAQEDCPVCLEIVDKTTAKITICKHIFCTNCIETVIQGQQKCPMCRTVLPSVEKTLVSPAAEEAGSHEEDNEDSFEDMDKSSSKLDALLHILQATREKDPTVKSIVFSQFTKFLDVIQVHLEKHDFEFVRLDGSMTPAKRDTALDTFNNSPKHTILLASLAVCSVGLNLVAASQVILGDSWWAPSIEDQAVDRVNRLGQTKRVTVFRLVMKDSVEERVLEIQQRKRQIISEAFNEKKDKRVRETRMADLNLLLSGRG